MFNKLREGLRSLFRFLSISMAFKTQGKVHEGTVHKKEEKLFTSQEIDFIAKKLRDANYKGTEFELFYSIMKKLADYSK